MPRAKIVCADILDGLRSLEDESVQCCITSPPYWGLRDYGVEGQIGIEKTPEKYVEKMVEVFREVRRVLRPDGVCFLNLGDSYAGGGRAGKDGVQKWGGIESGNQNRKYGAPVPVPFGLKPKDLVGIPWRVAFALQTDGWWLRRDIIWNKPNPMPEPAKDRPTSSHEYVFILTKRRHYFWDREAVREEFADIRLGNPGNYNNRYSDGAGRNDADTKGKAWNEDGSISGRNIRSVWTIATQPFPGEFCTACRRYYADGGRHLSVHLDEETEKESKICACGRWDSWISHFACFPQTLVEPMIKAGTSEKGCCPECGSPWARVVERQSAERDDSGRTHSLPEQRMGKTPPPEKGWESERRTIGFRPTCECGVEPIPCTVLDPFSGAGTTGLVALKLGRDFVGVELNPDYAEMARKRILQDAPLFNSVELSKVEDEE